LRRAVRVRAEFHTSIPLRRTRKQEKYRDMVGMPLWEPFGRRCCQEGIKSRQNEVVPVGIMRRAPRYKEWWLCTSFSKTGIVVVVFVDAA
jgi:hypothetical protein